MDRSRWSKVTAELAMASCLLIGAGLSSADAQAPQVSDPQARAATEVDVAVRAEAERVRKARQDTAVLYPYGLSGTSSNAASLVASTENKRVAVTATIPTSKLTALVVQASAPLSDDDTRSPVVQLDGLANKGKAGVEWRYGQQRVPSQADLTALTNLLVPLCLQNPEFQSNSPTETGLKIDACSLSQLESDAQRGAAAREAINKYFPRRASWFLTLKGDVGAESFKFLDPVTFQQNNPRKWSPSAAVIFGFLTSQNIYLAAGARFEKSYKPSDNQATCTISELSVKTACPVAIVGGPTSKTPMITEGEIRKYLPVAKEHNIGLSGLIHRDWDSKETSIEVPLYFVKDKDGGLSGGVSLGYVWSPQPNSQGPRFTVFVGQAFGLNNGS